MPGHRAGPFSLYLVHPEVVSRHQNLEAKFCGNLHVRDILVVLEPVPVVEVLDHLAQNHPAAVEMSVDIAKRGLAAWPVHKEGQQKTEKGRGGR